MTPAGFSLGSASYPTLRRDRSRRGARVHQLLRDRLHAEVEALQGPRPQEYQVAWLSEHDVVPRSPSRDADDHDASPALEHRSARLAKVPLIVALDPQRFEHVGRDPAQLGARVDQYGPHGTPLTRAGRVLELDVDAGASHIVRHSTSSSHAEEYHGVAGGVNTLRATRAASNDGSMTAGTDCTRSTLPASPRSRH